MFALFHPETNIIKFQCPEINIATASFHHPAPPCLVTQRILSVSFDHSLSFLIHANYCWYHLIILWVKNLKVWDDSSNIL